jgi:hypothetical protein
MNAWLAALLSGSGVSVSMRRGITGSAAAWSAPDAPAGPGPGRGIWRCVAAIPAAGRCGARHAGQGREHHQAGLVCNRNRVPVGDCHDGLWGQVAVWPSSLVRVAWGARSASALSPLVAAGSHGLLWDALLWDAREARPAGAVPAQARTGARAGALIVPKA